jgi:hypothetical protein
MCSALPTSGPTIKDNGFGYWLPTPAARDYKGKVKSGVRISKTGKVQKYGDQLPNVIGGVPNPDWNDWLMGFPAKWTALSPLEMPKFQQWCASHGIPFTNGSSTNEKG